MSLSPVVQCGIGICIDCAVFPIQTALQGIEWLVGLFVYYWLILNCAMKLILHL
jgi:hypothetical protein